MAREDITVRFNLDESGFKNGIKRAGGAINKFRKEISGKVGIALAGVFSVGLIKNIVRLGTAAAETASKFKAVFKTATDEMNESVQMLRKNIPATTAEIQNSLATFGQMARAFGMNAKAANKFSVSMVKISGDLASFHNMNPEEVFQKISAAVTGEFEPLKRLGIVINESILKRKAQEEGIYDGIGAMTASQKAITVQTLVLEQMGSALGDAERTAGSAANQIKFLKAEITETGTEIGITMIPAIAELTKGFGKLLDATNFAAEGTGALFGKLYVSVTTLSNGFEGYDGILSTNLKTTKEATQVTEEAIPVQKEFESKIRKTTKSIEEQEAATKDLEEQIKSYYEQVQDAIDLERERFIDNKELEVLKLRAQGEKAAADALENKIESMKKAINISNKYGISLQKAANLVENINRAERAEKESTGSGSTGSGSTESGNIVRGNIVRGNITTGRIKSVGSGTRESRFGRMPTMDERERAAGLTLRGNNTMSGRAATGAAALPPKRKSDKGGKDGESSTPEWQTAIITIKETVTKLDNALGSN